MNDLNQTAHLDVSSVAVIGMAGRFPGARNVEAFWRNIRDGVESRAVFYDKELRSIGLDPGKLDDVTLYRAVGCEACDHTGYRGRLGIFELMEMDTTLREMAFRSEPTAGIRDYARTSGCMSTLTDDGLGKVLAGTTTAEELLRVTAAAR